MIRVRVSSVRVVLLLGLLVPAAVIGAAAASRDGLPADGAAAAVRPPVSLPKRAEHRYRVAAKIRPLLLFWIGRDNVGSARMSWYRGAGNDKGYELLLGSDPARAPRKINQWGYVAEESRNGEAVILGVMKQSDDATLEDAQARLENERHAGYVFKMIREQIRGGEAVAEVTTARFGRDYSYRDFDPLLEEFEKTSKTPQTKRAKVDGDVTPGLLSTVSAVIREDAEARRRSPGSRGASGSVARYAYNAKIYTLTLASSQFLGAQQYGGRAYSHVVRTDFEVTMKGFAWKEKFTVVYSLDDPDAELPVFISYQPKWWFKAELVLDDSQPF